MTREEVKQIFKSSEGIFFILIFTLIFMVTNLIMVDFMDIQDRVTGQTPFFILILIAILAYLYKISSIEMNKPRKIFLPIWSLYVISMFISMLVNKDFIFPEALVLILLTVMFLYKMPKSFLFTITIAAFISLPALLLQDNTLNESGATLVLIYTAALIFLPRKNITMLYAALPTFTLLLIITTSRTAIGIFLLVTVIQLIFINVYGRARQHQKRFLTALVSMMIVSLAIFFRPLFSFFTMDGISADGVDLNQITNGRSDPWITILNNMSLLGEGRDYIDFTELLHVHNIFFDTLGRYGVVTTMLFVLVLGFMLVMAFRLGVERGFNYGLYIFAFILIGMFEYNYLFMFVYFSPIVLLFVVGSRVLNDENGKSTGLYSTLRE